MILGAAGSGGTATVYKAFDDETQSVVALKVFDRPDLDPDVAMELWNREVRALSTLQHEAVAQLRGAGRDEDSGHRYIVLEWLDGVSLEQHLEKTGRLGWDEFYRMIGSPLLA